jgi:hypothetical protein
MINWIASVVVLAMASAFVIHRSAKIGGSFLYGSKDFWPSMPVLILKSLGLSEPFKLWNWTEQGVFEGKMTRRQGLFMLVQSFVGTAFVFALWRSSLFLVSEFVFFGLAIALFVLRLIFKRYKALFSWELPAFYLGLLVMGTEWLLLASAQLYNSETPPTFVFVLGDTGALTLGVGLFLGFVWGFVTRSPLLFLVLGSLLLLSGFASLHFLVSLMFGHALAFIAVTILWTSKQSPIGRMSLILRGIIYFLCVGAATVILYFNMLSDYSPRGREFEWMIFAVSLFVIDHVIASVFYHFYSARLERQQATSF